MIELAPLDAPRGYLPGGACELRLNPAVARSTVANPTPWCESAEIGPHRLLAGDLTKNALMHLMSNDRADALYCDPPWGTGNLKYWHTHAKLEAPRVGWYEFAKLLGNVLREYVKPRVPIWIEMGNEWADDLVHEMACVRHGRESIQRWTTQYGNPLRPCQLLYAGPSLPAGFNPSALRGAKLPLSCLKACRLESGALVLDPCCGKGYTARAAHKLGLAFRGLELNPHRLGYTEQWLRKNQS